MVEGDRTKSGGGGGGVRLNVNQEIKLLWKCKICRGGVGVLVRRGGW